MVLWQRKGCLLFSGSFCWKTFERDVLPNHAWILLETTPEDHFFHANRGHWPCDAQQWNWTSIKDMLVCFYSMSFYMALFQKLDYMEEIIHDNYTKTEKDYRSSASICIHIHLVHWLRWSGKLVSFQASSICCLLSGKGFSNPSSWERAKWQIVTHIHHQKQKNVTTQKNTHMYR